MTFKKNDDYTFQEWQQICFPRRLVITMFTTVGIYIFSKCQQLQFTNMLATIVFQTVHISGLIADVHIRGFIAATKTMIINPPIINLKL